MNTVVINGVSYQGGSSVSVINGVVIIDGVRQDGTVSGVVEIRVVEGAIENLRTDAAVSCGNVGGAVVAGGSVTCGDVGGAVQAGGSVRCGAVSGTVMAGGSVRHG